MTDVVSLTARRWEKNEDPAAHTVRDMLVEAIRQLDAGELKASHAVLSFALDDDEGRGCDVGWLQAGNLPHLGQLGLLVRVSQIMGTNP